MFRPRNLLVLVLALIAAGSVTYAWLISNDLADLRRQLAESRAGAAELQKKLYAAEKPAPPPKPAATPVETAAAAPDGPPGGPPGENFFRNGGPARMAGLMAEMMADPKISAMMLESRKHALDQRYAALFRKLNLPPDQLEKLKTLMAEKEIARSDAQAMARTQGLGRDDVRAMAQQSDSDSDAQIKALIGEDKFTQLTGYDKTASQRGAVNQYAERLSYTGSPLSDQQNEQLVQLLAANPLKVEGARNNIPEFGTLSANFGNGGGGGGRGGDMNGAVLAMAVGRGASDEEIAKYTAAKAERDAAILQQASGFLNSTQLQALQQSQQEENNQITLMTTMRAKFREAMPDRAERQNRGNRRNNANGGG